MSHQVLKDTTVYIGGYDLTGDTNSVTLEHGADMVEDTTFGNDTHGMRSGLKMSSFSMEGHVNNAQSDDALYSQITVEDKPLSVYPLGSAEGNRGYGFLVTVGEFSPLSGAVGELNTYSSSAAAMGDLTSGVSDGIQVGAVTSSQKAYASLHVISGSGTLDVDIESDDNSDFTTEISRASFTQATGITSEWLEIDGPVTDDYWRINYTIGGGSPEFSFVVFFGIQ